MFIYQCDVPLNLPDMRIGSYLSKALPLLPESVIREALKKRDVKADGVRMSADETAPRGKHICLYTGYAISLDVIWRSEHITVINKPAGLSCDTDAYGGQTLSEVLPICLENGDRLRAVHRLDNRTCGLLILAEDDETEAVLTQAIAERRGIIKQYTCIVKGEMRPPAAIKEAWLVKNAAAAKVRIISHNTPGSKPICTEYRTLKTDGSISRLEITLHTGRTHQIRAHMASLGHPVLGDDLYGDRNFNKTGTGRLMLCASRLCFDNGFADADLRGKEIVIDPPF